MLTEAYTGYQKKKERLKKMSNKKPNTEGILKNAEEKTKIAIEKVEVAINQMLKEDLDINFNAVAVHSGVSKSFLYKNAYLKEKISQLRNNQVAITKEKKVTPDSKDVIIQALKNKIEKLEKENKELKKQKKDELSKLYEEI